MTVVNTDNENSEARPHCCKVEGERCTCLPYNDYLIILASCFAFVAFGLSWLWYVSLLVAIPGMIAFQTLWCCRQSAFQLYLFAGMAGICSLINIGVGIYWNTSFGIYRWCTPWNLVGDGNIDDYEPSSNEPSSNSNSKSADDDFFNTVDDYFTDAANDFCFETLFAILSYTCGLFWGMTCIFTICFVKSGRHAKREEGFHSAVANPVQVELSTTAVINNEYEEEPTNFAAIPIVIPTAVLEDSTTTTTTTQANSKNNNNNYYTSSNYS